MDGLNRYVKNKINRLLDSFPVAGGEIDLIVEGNFGMLPIEIKYQSHTPKKSLTALGNLIDLHSLPYGLVINNCNEPAMITEKIIELPAACV